ncbi:PD-(D/E)XK nuclease family protein [bacterium]|nr:PD-(D/E)XK nuclease family protein [bacterium]
MSLQFYTGRAGSGKTRRCLDEIVERLRIDPSPRAHPLILLLPEQATAQAEAALLSYPDIRGLMRARVLSFRRLAYVVLNETGGAPRNSLDDLGRQMLLRRLITRHEKDLKVFARSARQSGFIARLAATFTEMAHFRHSFEELDAQRERLEAQGRGESLLACKLHDLALLGKAWEDEMRARFSNPDHFLDELANRLAHSRMMRKAEVWLDGFSSFMPQELRVLEGVLRQAAHVRVSLLLDPDQIASLPETRAEADETRLFSQTEETFLKLKSLALDLAIDIEEPLVLPLPNQPTRFSENPAFEAFERSLAKKNMIPSQDIGDKDLPLTLDSLPDRLPPFTFVEAASPREEIEAVARAVRRLCREEGCRFRDMALILRDLETYEPLIRSTFARHGIPYFMDRRQPVGHHPLVALLRASLGCVVYDWSAEDVTAYLKTDFLHVGRHEIDRIENAARARDLHERRRWTDREAFEESLRPAQKAALGPLEALHQRCRAATLSGIDFVRALLAFLDGLEAGPTLAEWARHARETGDLDLADQHEQVWEGVTALIREMADTLGDEQMPLGDLAEVLETGLSGLTLGLVPPSLDQVLVGTVERSRQPEIRAALVIGLNDRQFPAAPAEDAIFSDSERRELDREGHLELAPPSMVRLFRERYLGYVAFTRPSRHLWMSWSLAGEDGRTLRPSPFVQIALEAARESVAHPSQLAWARLGGDWLDCALDAVETPEQAVEALVRSLADPSPSPGPWPLLRSGLADNEEFQARLERALGSQDFHNIVRLDATALSPLFGSDRPLSVSQLETYASCPFRYFAQYILSLKEREEFRIRPADVGAFNHHLLEMVFEKLASEFGKKPPIALPEGLGPSVLDWGDVPYERACAVLREAIEESRSEFLSEGSLRLGQLDFLLSRSSRQLENALFTFVRQGADDAFVQAGAEVDFGRDPVHSPPLVIQCDGRPLLRLQGKIDRVDLAFRNGLTHVRIFDFKARTNSLPLHLCLEGLNLQLLVYLATILAHAPSRFRPAGAFYFPLQLDFEKLDAPPEDVPREAKPIRVRGAFDIDSHDLFGPVEPGQRSPHVALHIKKDGQPGSPHQGDWMENPLLEKLIRHVCVRAAEWASDIRSGKIEVRPVVCNGVWDCQYCTYGDICRIDPHYNRFRNIVYRKRTDLLQEIKEAAEPRIEIRVDPRPAGA